MYGAMEKSTLGRQGARSEPTQELLPNSGTNSVIRSIVTVSSGMLQSERLEDHREPR